MEDIRAFGSPTQRQLQVRDNDQRTCFLLVWSDSGDGAAVLATGRTFRTIRTAIFEGVARFGTLAVRWRYAGEYLCLAQHMGIEEIS